MRLYLLRHPPPSVPAGVCYGHTDVALASGWFAEFQRVRNRLPRTDLREASVYTSPLRRCRRLADYLSPDARTEPRLKELDFGQWEGLRWDDIPAAEMRAWSSDFVDQSPPRGERYRTLFERCGEFLADLREEQPEVAIIVSHNGPIRALLAHLLELAPDIGLRLHIDFSGISLVHLDRDWIRIEYINR